MRIHRPPPRGGLSFYFIAFKLNKPKMQFMPGLLRTSFITIVPTFTKKDFRNQKFQKSFYLITTLTKFSKQSQQIPVYHCN